MSFNAVFGAKVYIPATTFTYQLVVNSSTSREQIGAFVKNIFPLFPKVAIRKDSPLVFFERDQFHLIEPEKSPVVITNLVFDYLLRQYCEGDNENFERPEFVRVHNFDLTGLVERRRFQIQAFGTSESSDGVNWTDHYGGTELS